MVSSSNMFGLYALAFLAPTLALPAAEDDIQRRSLRCTDFIIPVHATAHVKPLTPSTVPQNLNDPVIFTDFVISEAVSGLAALLGIVGTAETTGVFNMSARYCTPEVYVASRALTIQYLQHAITNTKDYWNGLSYPAGFKGETYSWEAVASKNGYATIALDNLGSGNSSHPDPFAVVQMSLQIEIIHQIVTKLRSGAVQGPVAGKKFTKVIYVGHSYGSICGNGLATAYPKDIDTYIFTGYSPQFIFGTGPLSSGIAIPAKLVYPRFAGLNPGYLAQSVEAGRQYGLYASDPTGYDPAIPFDDFLLEGTVAVGELATLFYGLGPADSYTGSVLVITGVQDSICCNRPTGANCGSGPSSIPAESGKFFPNAKNFTYIIPPKTGHSANLHYSSPNSFAYAHSYLAGQGF